MVELGAKPLGSAPTSSGLYAHASHESAVYAGGIVPLMRLSNTLTPRLAASGSCARFAGSVPDSACRDTSSSWSWLKPTDDDGVMYVHVTLAPQDVGIVPLSMPPGSEIAVAVRSSRIASGSVPARFVRIRLSASRPPRLEVADSAAPSHSSHVTPVNDTP